MDSESLCAKIRDKTATIGVIGLGYVGLPLAMLFHKKGFKVFGFDTDIEKIDKLTSGESYIGSIRDEQIEELDDSMTFVATTDMRMAGDCDAVIICLPTPLDEHREPNLSFIQGAAFTIGPWISEGCLVILESTTYPGTTRDILLPIIQEGMGLDAEVFVAYSPEREDPGNPTHSVGVTPKIVGGLDDESLACAVALYEQITTVVPVSSLEVAEACKILENTYRAVNIALVNEMKVLFDRMGLSIWEVIEAAKTKPFGFQAFYPGPGLGGHCIPIDPFYLTWLAKRYGMNTRFIELAGEVNSVMPRYVVQQAVRGLNDCGKAVSGSQICVIGLAYKRDVDDARESPAFEIIQMLLEWGADVTYHDPHIPRFPKSRKTNLKLESQPLTREYLDRQDCVVIVTDHSTVDWGLVLSSSRLIVDPRNALGNVPGNHEHVIN